MGVYRPPFYVHSVNDVPGTVAQNTLSCVFNPSTSNRAVIFFQAEIASYTVGATTTQSSLVARRVSASTGGTLIPAAQVNRFLTVQLDPIAEVRQGNPTITTDARFPFNLNSWPPPQSTGAGDNQPSSTATPAGEGFICLPGEGLAFTIPAGDTDQRWKLNVIWAERELS